jgi:hypothetical protein
VALCSLGVNSIGPEGAAAISHGLVSVPQLQKLLYVCCGGCVGGAVDAAGPCGAKCTGLGASVRSGCVCACERWRLCVWCDTCGCLRLWCRVALCSLGWNGFGPEGAAAISRGLASVPQLQTLKYVVAVCELVVPLRRRDPVVQSVRGWDASLESVGMRVGVPVCDVLPRKTP